MPTLQAFFKAVGELDRSFAPLAEDPGRLLSGNFFSALLLNSAGIIGDDSEGHGSLALCMCDQRYQQYKAAAILRFRKANKSDEADKKAVGEVLLVHPISRPELIGLVVTDLRDDCEFSKLYRRLQRGCAAPC